MNPLDRIDKEESALNELYTALLSVLTCISEHTKFHEDCSVMLAKVSNRLEDLAMCREQIISSAETFAGM